MTPNVSWMYRVEWLLYSEFLLKEELFYPVRSFIDVEKINSNICKYGLKSLWKFSSKIWEGLLWNKSHPHQTLTVWIVTLSSLSLFSRAKKFKGCVERTRIEEMMIMLSFSLQKVKQLWALLSRQNNSGFCWCQVVISLRNDSVVINRESNLIWF